MAHRRGRPSPSRSPRAGRARGRGTLDVWVQMLRRKPLGTVGGVIVLGDAGGGACWPTWIAPYGFAQTSLRERFIAMNAAHWLGTDQLGRDLLTRLIYGARISLYVGFGAVALGSVLATAVGILSAYFGGRVDLLVQRGVDAWMAFPPLLLLMSIMSLLGPSVLEHHDRARRGLRHPELARGSRRGAARSRSTPTSRARAPLGAGPRAHRR